MKNMLKSIFSVVLGLFATTTQADDSVLTQNEAVYYSPYQNQAANNIYNMLFCDNPGLFKSRENSGDFIDQLGHGSLPLEEAKALAADERTESRIRLLAYNQLRANNETIEPKKLLGVVVELITSDAENIDTLAAYRDYRTRLINSVGDIGLFDSPQNEILPTIAGLLAAADAVLAKQEQPVASRTAPPTGNHVRFTLLSSDGLYVVDTPMDEIQQDEDIRTLFHYAGTLVQAILAGKMGEADDNRILSAPSE